MSADESPPLIWERPEPDERRAATPLTRAQLVAAAVRLADADGLAAVSIRHVAASLGVRPMRLYSHVTGKDDVLDLMIDAVYAEISEAVGVLHPEHWHARARAIAHATRAAVQRHPWAIDLLGGRPQLGPHTLEVGEATAAAFARAPGLDDVQALRAAAGAFNSYLLGALRREIGEVRAGQTSGLTLAQWQAALGPYLSRQLATGRLPTLERLVRAPDPDADEAFDAQLTVVLQGLGAQPSV
jgi:AcrR family transcriptional regulator